MTAEQTEAPTDEVLFDRRGHLGVITVNRPNAVIALIAGMVADLTERLADWENDDGVAAVLVQGAGERGLVPAVTSWPFTATSSPAARRQSPSGKRSIG